MTPSGRHSTKITVSTRCVHHRAAATAAVPPQSLPPCHPCAHATRTQANAVDRKTFIDGLCNIVGKAKVRATIRGAMGQKEKEAGDAKSPPSAGATSAAPSAGIGSRDLPASADVAGQAQTEAAAGAPGKRPAGSAGSEVAGTKRPRASTCAQGYADAANSSEAGVPTRGGGSGGRGATGGGDGKKDKDGDDVRSQLDPLAMAGVDVQAEAAEEEITAREGGHDEARRFGSGEQGELLRKKLEKIAKKFGLQTADDASCRLVAVAMQEHITAIIEALRPASRARTNAAKEALGESGRVVTGDPTKAWAKQQQQQQAARAQVEEQKRVLTGPGRVQLADSAQPGDDARQMESVVGVGRGGGGRGGTSEAVANVADVLYVLEGEPTSRHSRVVQWWRCNNAPLARYVRPSARLYPPPQKP